VKVAAVAGLLLASLVLLPGGHARPRGTQAASRGTILLGGTAPLSGPESAYAPIARGAAAYFQWVDAHGGVRGHKIVYRYLDDGYDASRTVEATRRLVLEDRVFAVFNTIGTEHALAIRPFLNALKIPQLFVGSGADAIGRGRARYPWTMGYLPSFSGEGAVYGRYLARTRPEARIAVLYENSEYGRELFAGLRRGLGRRARRIVEEETYEVTDPDVSAQVSRLKASGANTFMILALPKQALQSFVAADRLGWRPHVFVTSVSIDPAVMAIARSATHDRLTQGAVSMAFLKDPTDARLARDAAVRLYRKIMRRYLPDVSPKAVAHFYGMAVAFTMVDALRHAGRNPTRASLLRAATHLRERNPFLRRGIVVRTTRRDYYPIDQAQLVRFRKGRWLPFGRLVRTR
jgi:branched-chain amino acid transport system substrate-binding protein